jgi:hypothetical protein
MQSITPTLQSASLHFREGNSDKVYHAEIEPKGEGYLVSFGYPPPTTWTKPLPSVATSSASPRK